MVNFLVDHFSECVFLAIFLAAMCPMFESKIAVPLALSVGVWGTGVLSPGLAFLAALLGSFVPCVFIVLLSRYFKHKVSGFVHDKFIAKAQSKYKSKLENIAGKNSAFLKCLTLSTFVAVPLPMTGVWTGSMIAGLSGLKLWQALLSIFVGTALSCGVMLLVCLVFENSIGYILLATLLIIALFVLVNLLLFVVRKFKNKHKEIEISCLV